MPAFSALPSRTPRAGAAARRTPGAASRLVPALAALGLFLAGWGWLAQQHAALWQRLPATAAERFAADLVPVALPGALPWTALQDLCAQPAPAWQPLLRGAWRRQLAACLGEPATRVQGEPAARAAAGFEAEVRARADAAAQWLQAWEAQAPQHRAALATALQAAQRRPAGALQPLVDVLQPLAGAPAQRGADTGSAAVEPAAERAAAGAAASREPALERAESPAHPSAGTPDPARAVRQARLQAQALLAAQAGRPDAERALALGLAATGLQLARDFGHAPPRAVLLQERGSLGDTLERQHRAQRLAAQAGGTQVLAALQAVPAALMAGGAVLLATGLLLAAAGRAPRWSGLAWAGAAVLAGLGALLLTDLALTGDPALRHLAARQLVSFGAAGVAVPLLWEPIAGMVVSWPLLAVAAALAALALAARGRAPLLAPVGSWVAACAEPARAGWPAALLLAMALAWALAGGLAAAASEALLAVAAIGLASYAARQSALAATGAGLQAHGLTVVVVAVAAALAGALWRADLGHALVALALLALFAALFAGGVLRAALALGAAAGMALLLASWHEGAWRGPLAWLAGEALPPHAQQRMLATFDPFRAEASDLARVRWLMESAGLGGWGPGRVPWLGLDPARAADGLPQQGPSDYVPALLVAAWGQPGGLLLAGAVVLLFGAAAVCGLRTAAGAGVPPSVRALAALGGFGCAGMALRSALSLGGVTGTLPLTGVPVALLGYGPVTQVAALAYLALALGLRPPAGEPALRGVRVAPALDVGSGTGSAGPGRRALAWGLAGLAGVGLMVAASAALLARGAGAPQHVAQDRLAWAGAIAQALRSQGTATGTAPATRLAGRAGGTDRTGGTGEEALAGCAPAAGAVQAWNERLAAAAEPARGADAAAARAAGATPARTARAAAPGQALHLDAAALLQALPLDAAGGCTRWARALGRMLQADFTRIAGAAPPVGRAAVDGAVPPWMRQPEQPEVSTVRAELALLPDRPELALRQAQDGREHGQAQGAREGGFDRLSPNGRFGLQMARSTEASPLASRLAALEPAQPPGPRAADYATGNAWWGLPGCLAVAGQPCGDPARWHALPWAAALPLDPWLQRHLVPALRAATRQPAGQARLHGHAVAQGPALRLTLRPALQQAAQTLAECFVGDGDATRCAAVVPAQPAWQERYLAAPQRMRAGAVGLVLVDVASGEVVAMAGSVSACSAVQLARAAAADRRGAMPALRPGQACAQLPDRRMAWLAQQHPALWMLPPGSAVKPLALAAGIDAGLVPRSDDARWLRLLAESEQRLPVQQLALASGARYLQVLAGAGFGRPAEDLLWGGRGAGWPQQPMQGTGALRPTGLTLEQAERIRAEKAAGLNVDRLHGPAAMREFLAARSLADAALGGADIRLNAWALADIWRQIALRAQGAASAPRPHLARGPVQPATQALGWLSPQAAQRTLAATAGVTAAAQGGTAQGSCRWAFGACPPQGWPGLAGKTGTSDFLLREQGTEAKPGLQLPAKLFGGVFTAADGRRYAVGAMALRVRQAGTDTLELPSSAAAEAALLMARALGAGSAGAAAAPAATATAAAPAAAAARPAAAP